MKSVIQRVSSAEVHVEGKSVGKIGTGVLTLLGVEAGDDELLVIKTIEKICHLRIFPDDAGKMNRSLIELKGAHLIISQFTLAGVIATGRRPSFTLAEKPERAKQLYELAIASSRKFVPTESGIFQADMKVSLVNDGPVTFVL